MGAFSYWYDVGQFRGRTYYVGVRAAPSLQDVSSFAVVLYYQTTTGQSVEVAKVDNASPAGAGVHVDRYYRDADAPQKDYDVDIATLHEAERYLREHWRRFARQHDDTP